MSHIRELINTNTEDHSNLLDTTTLDFASQ